MNKKELAFKLEQLKINSLRYSLNGALNIDSIILIHHYFEWEVFYLDERGGRNNRRSFDSEDQACAYIYSIFLDSIKMKNKFGISI